MSHFCLELLRGYTCFTFQEAFLHTSVVLRCYFCVCGLPVSCIESGHCLLTSLINKMPMGMLLRAGFLFAPSSVISKHCKIHERWLFLRCYNHQIYTNNCTTFKLSGQYLPKVLQRRSISDGDLGSEASLMHDP